MIVFGPDDFNHLLRIPLRTSEFWLLAPGPSYMMRISAEIARTCRRKYRLTSFSMLALSPATERTYPMIFVRSFLHAASTPESRSPQTSRNSARLRSEEHTSELQSLAYLVCR